ncbi:hypothetical protein ON010_g18633 [Phytophthora cinnamomi]|nr:hypothetical protein ON010_g18633 [Phytophthora cinnamomi]
MQNVVHVDEKWFYVHRNRNTYYLTGGEPAPRTVTKNKTHRTKQEPAEGHSGHDSSRDDQGRLRAHADAARHPPRSSEVGQVIFLCKEEVTILQDNAPPHRASGRTAVKAAAAAGGWSIKFANQPSLSPDFNELDLGWFNSLQSLQYKKQTRDVDGLIAAVKAALEEMIASLSPVLG